MKTCKYCDERFDETEQEPGSPGQLGAISLETARDADSDDVCPKCKEELGIINLMVVG